MLRSLLALTLLYCLVPSPAIAQAFDVCGDGKRVTCVVDGDTFWLQGEKIRLEGFDSPEMGQPKCDRMAPLAAAARDRLAELLNAGEITIDRHGLDRCGRTLATITAAGVDIAAIMIAEGLGRPYVAGATAWCD